MAWHHGLESRDWGSPGHRLESAELLVTTGFGGIGPAEVGSETFGSFIWQLLDLRPKRRFAPHSMSA